MTTNEQHLNLVIADYYTPKKPVVHEKGTTGSQ